jgi:hypothetical protein
MGGRGGGGGGTAADDEDGATGTWSAVRARGAGGGE